jgi:hypothetical protein
MPQPSVNRLGVVAALLAIVLAVWVGWLVGRTDEIGPPPAIPHGLRVTLMLMAPGVIGLVGALTNRPVALVAAAVTCIFQGMVAMSGATVPFLIPAILFLRSAVGLEASEQREPWRPWRMLLLVVLAVPVALWLVFFLGLFVVVPLIVIGVVGPSLGKYSGTRVGWRDGLVGIAVVGLVLAAFTGSVATSEEVCWVARRDATGTLRYERVADDSEGFLDPDIEMAGCDSGRPTPSGQVLTFALLGSAIAVSFAASRQTARRRPASS